MSRSCTKEQRLVFIVRQSRTLKHAILSLTSGPGSTCYTSSHLVSDLLILCTGGGGGGGGGDQTLKLRRKFVGW